MELKVYLLQQMTSQKDVHSCPSINFIELVTAMIHRPSIRKNYMQLKQNIGYINQSFIYA